MRTGLGLGCALALLATAAAAQERRELDAHEHGHSSLDVVVEGDEVVMMLTAPGADIVGFEHRAETEDDRAALEAATAALEDPLALFVLPADAGCAVDAAEVRQVFEEEAHEDEHEHEEEGHEEAHDEHAEEATHSAFEATYRLACTDPSRIEGITFAFFERFPGAQEVEVNLVTERGQSRYEVERDEPRLELEGQV